MPVSPAAAAPPSSLAARGQEVTVSQFLAQLDEAARKKLDSMNQRLRLLEQQMETLEAKASSTDVPTSSAIWKPLFPSY